MNFKVQMLAILLAMGWGISSIAQVLVVSDIDDTIKISHVLDRPDALFDAARTQNLFLGSNTLYQFLNEKFKSQGVDFIYLSTAPDYLMLVSHAKFLKINNFPKGRLILPSGFSEIHDHKINNLRILLKQKHYNHVILLGDNGERDIEIYAQIKKEFPANDYSTFIHQVYFSAADEHQGKVLDDPTDLGFVTPIDVAFGLNEKGLLDQSDMVKIGNTLIPGILSSSLENSNGVLSFPSWMDCRDFDLKRLDKIDSLEGNFLKYSNLVFARCSVSGVED